MWKKYGSTLIYYYIRQGLLTVGGLFASGTMIQSFMDFLGISSEMIGLHTSILNVVSVAGTMACSGFIDRFNSVKKITSFMFLPYGFLFVALMPFLLIQGIPIQTAFLLVLFISAVQTGICSVRQIFDIKLIYEIIEPRDCDRVFSLEIIVSGSTSILAGFALNYAFTVMPEKNVFLISFGVCTVLMLLSAVSTLAMKSRYHFPKIEAKKGENGIAGLVQLFRTPVFTKLLIPNFVRGLATGLVSIAAVFALEKDFSTTELSYLVTASSVATLVAGGTYALLARKFSTRTIILIGGLCYIPMIFMSEGSVWLFLICYFITYGGKVIADCAIPSGLYAVVPFEISGMYHAWRMILTGAGTAAAAAAGGFLLKYVPAFVILGFGVACQIYCCLVYYRKLKRDSSFFNSAHRS